MKSRVARGLAGFGLAIAVTGLAAVAAVLPAQAGDPVAAATDPRVIELHDDHRGSTADGFGSQECDGMTPKREGYDGWHFVLPSQGGPGGAFVSLTLTFAKPDGTRVTKRIPGDGQIIRGKHAVIYTPVGWTLVDGKAVVSGASRFFNLSHTCPGEEAGSPTATPSTTKPTERPTESPSTPGTPSSTAPSETPGTSTGPTTPPSPSADVPGDNGGDLPRTGIALGGILALGVALVGGGIALRMVKRRRGLTDTAS